MASYSAALCELFTWTVFRMRLAPSKSFDLAGGRLLRSKLGVQGLPRLGHESLCQDEEKRQSGAGAWCP